MRYSRKFITVFVSQVVSRIQLTAPEGDGRDDPGGGCSGGGEACSHSSEIEVSEISIEPMVQTIDRDKEKHSRHGTCQNLGDRKYHFII